MMINGHRCGFYSITNYHYFYTFYCTPSWEKKGKKWSKKPTICSSISMVILVGEMRVLIRPQSVFGHGEINIQEAYFKDCRGKNDPLFTLQIHQLNVSDFYLPFTALACWIRLVVPTLGIHQIFTLDNMWIAWRFNAESSEALFRLELLLIILNTRAF